MRQTCVVPPVVARSQPVKVLAFFRLARVLAVPPKLAAWPLVSVAQKLLVTVELVLRAATRPPTTRVLPPVALTAPVE